MPGYRVRDDEDQLRSQQGEVSSLRLSTFFTKGDSVYVIATPNDGIEDGAPVVSNTVIIGNSAPTDATVTITSDNNFFNDSTLTCTATANDLDEVDGIDTLSYAYAWSTGAAGETLILDGSIAPGTDITCTATVSEAPTILQPPQLRPSVIVPQRSSSPSLRTSQPQP